MFKELSGFASLLKNAQTIGPRFQEVNSRLREKRVEGTAEGGLVHVEMNGVGELVRVTLAPSIVDASQTARLENLVTLAVNEASVKARQTYAAAMKELVAELNLPIPGIDKLLSQFP